jgi:hypothetical protein
MRYNYPPTRAEDLIEDLHGVQVPDPYRWMEDLESAELRQWIEAQNTLTFDLLDSSPLRSEIRERMTALWNYEKYSPPAKKAGRYFYFYNDGLQNQSVLYWMADLEDEPKVLIDPNTLSEDGTVALSGAAISRDGEYLAYGVADAGSDWRMAKTLRIRSIGSSFPARAGMRRARAFSTAAMTRPRAKRSNRPIISISSTITSWARTNRKMCWSMTGPTRRAGCSMLVSARTGAIWSSTSPTGPPPRTRSSSRT